MKWLVYVFIMLSSISFVACSNNDDDDLIWDFAPVTIKIALLDEDGNNLLDESVEGNWVGEQMSLDFNGEISDAIWSIEALRPNSRYYMPHMYGLVWSGLSNFEEIEAKEYYLIYGELEGGQSYSASATFSIEKLNTVVEFELVNNVKWVKKKPVIDRYLNYQGKKIDDMTLTLTIPANDSN